MAKLIFATQKLDPDDPVLAATVPMVRALAERVDELVVLCDSAVPAAVPPNARVHEFGARSQAERGARFTAALAAASERPKAAAGVALPPLDRVKDPHGFHYRFVDVRLDGPAQRVELTVAAPDGAPPASLDEALAAGAQWWPLQMARELDDAELEAFGGHAQEATRGGYERIATWDEDFRILYGLYHYLSEMAPFAEAVGAPELNVELRARMEETGHRRLADIRAMGDVAPVWAHWGNGGPTFTAP